jgi:hypothetical protein
VNEAAFSAPPEPDPDAAAVAEARAVTAAVAAMYGVTDPLVGRNG